MNTAWPLLSSPPGQVALFGVGWGYPAIARDRRSPRSPGGPLLVAMLVAMVVGWW